MSATKPLAHSFGEDVFAIFIGTMFIALGISMLKAGGLSIGGTAGISFLIHVITGLPFGLLFFVVNIPFFYFAFRAFGKIYLFRSIVATALLSVESSLMPRYFEMAHIEPIFAAVVGGILTGMGLLALIRHRTGIGGINTLTIYLQERYGWRAGYVQMALDAMIVAAALVLLPLTSVLMSILSVFLMTLVIGYYHRPGRYLGF